MKKVYVFLMALMLTIAATAQTLNVTEGNVTYQFPASQVGDMTFANGVHLFKLEFPPGVELLDHMATLFLLF